MEKNDLEDLFFLFRKELIDDRWSCYLYMSLINNFWYHIPTDILYCNVDSTESTEQENSSILQNRGILVNGPTIQINPGNAFPWILDHPLTISKRIYNWRLNNLFRNKPSELEYYIFSQKWYLLNDKDPDFKVSDEFLILKKTNENLNHIKSLSINYKINKIIR